MVLGGKMLTCARKDAISRTSTEVGTTPYILPDSLAFVSLRQVSYMARW